MAIIISQYGSTEIVKIRCFICDYRAFLVSGRKACCGAIPTQDEMRQFISQRVILKKEGDTVFRRKPGPTRKKKILEEQDGRCFWCELTIGYTYAREGRVYKTKLAWDHVLPYSFGANNHDENFVASCNLCNSIKSNLIFENKELLIKHLEMAKASKGIEIY